LYIKVSEQRIVFNGQSKGLSVMVRNEIDGDRVIVDEKYFMNYGGIMETSFSAKFNISLSTY